MSKFCIAVVDCLDSNAFRVEVPSAYMPKAKKTEEEIVEERRARLRSGEWPRDEDEEVNLIDFKRIIKKIGVFDEFQIGYLAIPESIGNPFYVNQDTQRLFTKHNPRVINKDDFQQIIDMMRKMIVDQYHDILQDRRNWQGVLETKMEMWEASHTFPYNLENGSKSITNLYIAEVQIWDLVRMYKAIDWMRNTVVVYQC